MHAIVLISIVVQHLVTVCEAQLTADDNICDLYKEDIDQLFKCREDLAAVTANVKHANDMLQRKDDYRKIDQFEENCTLSETRKVCFQRDNLIPFGSEKPSAFNDLDQFPPSDMEKVFVIGMTLYNRHWGRHVVIGAIEVTYNASSAIFQHGSLCKEHANGTESFRLDPGDRITNISAKAGLMIDQLTFITKNGRRYGPYGSSGGGAVRLNPQKPNGYLAYVEGSETTTVGCRSIRFINFVWGYA